MDNGLRLVFTCNLLALHAGGYKLWECSLDLAYFLANDIETSDFPNMQVMELGCGQGIPGIVAQILGAETHFQDYDENVVRHLTIPTVTYNFRKGFEKRSRFFSGDWGTLDKTLSSLGLSGTYDLVLTSETIYNLSSIQRLLDCIKKVCI